MSITELLDSCKNDLKQKEIVRCALMRISLKANSFDYVPKALGGRALHDDDEDAQILYEQLAIKAMEQA